MENTADIRVGAFVWKSIDMFSKGRTESPEFKFGNYNCFLDITEYNKDNITHCYKVDLNESANKFINYKTFCKLCLIDSRGKERLETKRTTLVSNMYSGFCYIPLMSILKEDLNCEDRNGLSEGVTLRLSWCDVEDSNREQGTQMASDLNSEEKPRKLLELLSEDFGRFYENKVNTDFLLKVGEDLIPVHRAVLSARSEVFAAMLRHDTLENKNGVVDIPDVDVSILSDVLYYIYSGQTRRMSKDTVVPMYVVADKYALIGLRDACLDVLMCSLTVENVCDAALLAHTHGETKLEEEVVQFIKLNLKEIKETDKWKDLLKSKSSLAAKLLCSALMIYIESDESSSSK